MTFATLPIAMLSMDDIVRYLAIVGGGAVGAFVTGFLTQTIVRGYTGQTVPQWVVWTLRILGGVAFGWLVYLLVFGQGGSLFGGLGGGGNGKDGGGKDSPRDTTPAVTTPKDGKADDKSKDGSPVPVDKSSVVRVQVLGDDPLQEMVKAGRVKSFDSDRCYRVDDDGPADLKTLKEVEQYLLQRVRREPPLKRIELVLYKDSPQKKVPRVSELKKWADDLTLPGKDEKVIVDYKELGEAAPVR